MMSSMTSSMGTSGNMSSAVSMSSSSSTGRSKTEQVVLECLYKAVEVVLQARIYFPYGQSSRNRRARFNLDIDELESVRHELRAWKDTPHIPLCLSIYWNPSEEEGVANRNKSENRELLERWLIHYSPYRNFEGNSSDVIARLRVVCKRIGVFLRALFTHVRLLPTHSLYKRCQGTSVSSCLTFSITNAEEANPNELEFPLDIATSRFGYSPIETPFGVLKISTAYRREVSFFIPATPYSSDPQEVKTMLMTNIIQDYVPVHSKSANEDDIDSERSRGVAISPPIKSPSRRTSISSPISSRERNEYLGSVSKQSMVQLEHFGGSSPMQIPRRTQSESTEKKEGSESGDSELGSSIGSEVHENPSPLPQRFSLGSEHRDGSNYLSEPKARSYNSRHSLSGPGRGMHAGQNNPTTYNVTAAPFGYRNIPDKNSVSPNSPFTASSNTPGKPPHPPMSSSPFSGFTVNSNPMNIMEMRKQRSSSISCMMSTSGGNTSTSLVRHSSSRESYNVASNSPLISPPFSFSPAGLSQPSPFSLEMPIQNSPPFRSNPTQMLSSSSNLLGAPSPSMKDMDRISWHVMSNAAAGTSPMSQSSLTTSPLSSSILLTGNEGSAWGMDTGYTGCISLIKKLAKKRRHRLEHNSTRKDSRVSEESGGLVVEKEEAEYDGSLPFALSTSKETLDEMVSSSSTPTPLANFVEKLKTTPDLYLFRVAKQRQKDQTENPERYTEETFEKLRYYQEMQDELQKKLQPNSGSNVAK